MRNMFRLILIAILITSGSTIRAQISGKSKQADYNIVWKSESLDATGSMPVGGGKLGLNVWVEKGDLLFYIGSPEAFDEKGNVIKLGRIRIKTNPNIFVKDFHQELVLNDGHIRFKGEMENGKTANILLWVDAYKPVIHIEFDCAKPVDFVAVFETWTNECPRYQATFIPNGLEWGFKLDQNVYNETRLKIIQQCGMDGLESKVLEPGRNLIMGGRIIAKGMVPNGEVSGKYMSTTYKGWSLKSSLKTKKLDLHLFIRIDQDESYSLWQKALDKLEKSALQTRKSDFKKTSEWWNRFNARTYIHLNPNFDKLSGEKDTIWQVGRNYQLFRYMLGCNSSGKFPTLFNGGFFNVDVPVYTDQIPNQSPDARLWGSTGFMAQNQRLLYWPLLKSGDYDVLKVVLDFYKDRVEAQRARAKKCFGVDGTPFPESINWFGLFSDGLGAKSGHSSANHLEYHYTSTLDFAYLMLEYARFSGNDIRPYLPVVEGIISYYDQFYRKENTNNSGKDLGDNGKLVIYPSCAVEFAQGAKNNTDVIAGLDAIAEGLLALPEGILEPEKIDYYKNFRATLPAFPTLSAKGEKYLAVAESYSSTSTWQNIEFPQMYSVFPFHRFGIGLPNIDLAKNTWNYGWINRVYQDDYICWYQNGIFTARMGMSDTAKIYTIKKFLHSGEPPRLLYKQWPSPCYPMRFPTFYNTFTFDHAPDMDHGGSAMIGLQEMLIQTPGEKILLFPAWPNEWDVDFKMKAPYNTTVEGKFRNGKLNSLKVLPKSRKKDIVLMNN
jgi:hypothetical protein